MEMQKVTRYNGFTGYDILMDGEKVGHVYRAQSGWAYSTTAFGVYASGSGIRTRELAADRVASAVRNHRAK